MSRKRVVFRNPESGHEVSTGLPVEQNRLRALGYVEKKPASQPRPAVPAKSESKQ